MTLDEFERSMVMHLATKRARAKRCVLSMEDLRNFHNQLRETDCKYDPARHRLIYMGVELIGSEE